MSNRAHATVANPNAAILPKPGVRDESAGDYALEASFELGPDDGVLVHTEVSWRPRYPEYDDEVVAQSEALGGELAVEPGTYHLVPEDLIGALGAICPIFAALAPALMRESALLARSINRAALVRLSVEFYYASLYGAIRSSGPLVSLELMLPDLNPWGQTSFNDALEAHMSPSNSGGLAFRSEVLDSALEPHRSDWLELLATRGQELAPIMAFRPDYKFLEPA